MGDPFSVQANERGMVRVFTTELEPEGDAAITAQNVHKILGKDLDIDPAKVEVFPAKVIAGMGLATYLREGYGIPEADLAGKAAALDALKGLIILIPSSAFEDKAQVLDPNQAVRFLGAFQEPAPKPPVQMAPTESAEGRTEPGKSRSSQINQKQRKGSWIVALGALIIAATLVLFAVF
ncbi:MAG: hypothetical protein HKN18_08840 [Silicimonas sp.]|nr:hypothetical protein [Silicimonas sp.]